MDRQAVSHDPADWFPQGMGVQFYLAARRSDHRRRARTTVPQIESQLICALRGFMRRLEFAVAEVRLDSTLKRSEWYARAPRRGKATQAQRFAKAHGIPRISTGDSS